MTFKMVRCRWVSDESTECSRPSAPADEVSLLSLMAMNVTPPGRRIKHVFDCVSWFAGWGNKTAPRGE
jgi:hypothetical protein